MGEEVQQRNQRVIKGGGRHITAGNSPPQVYKTLANSPITKNEEPEDLVLCFYGLFQVFHR